MNDTVPAKAAWHFWLIAALSLLWNGFGGYDYVMTRQRNLDYLGQMGNAQDLLAWIDGFPLWVQVLWPVGVWTSVLGSLMLLARSRHAVAAFAVSLIGAIASFAGQMLDKPPPSLDTTANTVMPIIIVVLILAQWWYARRVGAQGILR
jgi:hypothetical protein